MNEEHVLMRREMLEEYLKPERIRPPEAGFGRGGDGKENDQE